MLNSRPIFTDEVFIMFSAVPAIFLKRFFQNVLFLLFMSGSVITYAKSNTSYYGTFGEQQEKNWLAGAYSRYYSKLNGIGFSTFRLSAFAASVENIENNNRQTHFTTVDASVGYQIGHQFYLYTDIGIDLGEVIAWFEFSSDDTTLDPDRYFTLGTGMKIGDMSINLYSKYRHISGYFVASQYGWYQGLELGMRF